MHKVLQYFNLHRPTIARDLTLSLVAIITFVFALAGTINYLYSLSRDRHLLQQKATETADDMASVLATPLWNLNIDELQKVVAIYRRSGVVRDINLVDENGGELVPFIRSRDGSAIEMKRVVTHEHMPIGTLTVAFADTESTLKQRQVALYSLAVFSLLTFALTCALTVLLKRILQEPLRQLVEGLTLISDGQYHHTFKAVRQQDINEITAKVTFMSREIAKREHSLEENRTKLETLNEAILDIFSCPDTLALLRRTLVLSNRVCGIERGWFVANTDFANAEGSLKPPPLVAVRGELQETTEAAALAQIAGHDQDLLFTFPIKSRYHTVGQMSLAFPARPDPAMTALLRSLMSLATLALIRQSFIRETAFISAELQVAAAVQRSMLLDEAKMTTNAEVAYYYEPVLRVGGDWFNVIESRDGSSVYIILGDVTGHGLAQGLITTAMAGAMSVVEALIRDGSGSSVASPAAIVTQLGNVIRKLIGKSNLRMTCVAAQIDFITMRLSICNAGHTFPLALRQSDGAPKLEALAKNQQLMLGDDVADAATHSYSNAVYEFHPDDLLIFYTDGLTEAVDSQGRAFQRPFQRHVGRLTKTYQVNALLNEILDLFKVHTQSVPIKDDICLVVVGKKPTRVIKAA